MVGKTKPATTEELDRMSAIVELGCIVCLLHYSTESPCSVHHMVEGGKRLGHKFTIGLCGPHHNQGIRTPFVVSRHPYKAEFDRRYGSEYELLEETNRRLGNAWQPKKIGLKLYKTTESSVG